MPSRTALQEFRLNSALGSRLFIDARAPCVARTESFVIVLHDGQP
jgi:hypothetical protein